MRSLTAALPLFALTLAGCGPKQLALPDDPIERAATCGVIAAAAGRTDVNSIKGALPFDDELHVIHFSLLAGAEGKTFAREKASAVAKRMPELADKVTAGKWQALEQPCAAAFPESPLTAPAKLPEAKADQQLGCYVLADFLRTALQSQDANYGEQLSSLGDLRRTLDAKLGARFTAKGQTDAEDQKAPRDAALVAMIHSGPPAKLLKLCVAQFPPAKTAL